MSYYFLCLVAVIAMTFFATNLTRSRVGRAFVAIRDNDLAAGLMGINVAYYKVVAFFISSVYAGIAGSLFAHYVMALAPDYFTFMNSVWYLGAIVIGGMGSTLGSILGAVFMRLVIDLTDYLNLALVAIAPELAATFIAATSMVFMGGIIVAFLILEPRGLAHRWQLFKASYRLHPFSY